MFGGSGGSGTSGSGTSGSAGSTGLGGDFFSTTGSGGSSASGTTSTSASGGGLAPPTTTAACAGKIYTCGNLLDDDKDGLVDSQDPDCLGPCDDTEDGLNPELPGAKGGECKLDCFWDNGNGAGNDDCYWDHRCDKLEVPPNYPPEGPGCAYDPTTQPKPGLSCEAAFTAQSTTCLSFCKPLVPNGCDCFGCCELPAGGGKFAWLGAFDSNGIGSCKLDTLGDPAKCPPCTPVQGCQNECGHFELCVGKTQLPLDCVPGEKNNPQGCSSDLQPCGLANQSPCPNGSYCITGCCVPVPQ